MSILHAKSITVADGTNTDIVRPSDWLSAHNQVLNIGGNTLGTSQISGADIVWAGGSNVTLSANGSTVSVIGVPAQTNQTVASGNIAGSGFSSTTTAGTAIVGTNNSNGLSIGVPAYITTYAAQTNQTVASGNIAGAGYTFTTQAGTSIGATHNSAGLSLAQPLFLTTAAQSNHSHNFATTTTNGSNIVVGTTNSAGATIGVPAYLTTAAATDITSGRAGTGTTLGFSGGLTGSVTLNTNGINLALSEIAGTDTWNAVGNTIAGQSTSGTWTNDVYAVSGAGVASVGVSNNTLIISVPTGGVVNQTGPNIAVAGSTVTDGTVLFSNANGVTFGLNGSTMTASAAGGGGAGVTIKDWFPMQMAASSTSSFGQNTVHFAHLLPQENISCTCIEMLWSYSHSSSAIATWGKTTTLHYGIYSEDAAGTNMALMSSSSMVIQMTASSNVSFALTMSQGTNSFTTQTAASALTFFNQAGWKAVSLPFAASLPPSSAGPYYFAYRASTASGGANVAQTHQIMMNNEVSNASIGGWSPATVLATNKSLVQEPYGFILSVTSNALPAAPAYSDMSINSNTQPYLYFEA